MGHQDRDDDDGVFRALALVCGGGVGKRDLIQLRGIVLDHSPVEVDGECPFLQIYLGYCADVAVEDICKKQVFDQQFSEKLVSADFGKQLLHILIDKAVMRQRAAASLLGA